MNLEQFHKLTRNRLNHKFDNNEVEEFFFILIDHYCQIDKLKYIINSKLELKKKDELNLINSLDLLENESPIQYVIGQTQFMAMTFLVNHHVLIPRPETEELVRWIVQDLHSNKRVLDIGTGSGCIATSLSKLMDNCIVYGWDISSNALDIASKNSKNNSVNVKYDLVDITNEKQSIYFEINENFSKQVNKLLKKEGFHDIIVRKDFRGKYRMVKATKK